MKRTILAIALAAAAGAANAGMYMPLVEEIAKPAGQRNLCAYAAEGLVVAIGAPTFNAGCPRAIEWSQWDRTGQGKQCTYTFHNGNYAVTEYSGGVTYCYRSAEVLWR